MSQPAEWLLAYLVMPLWFGAGIADWFSHRRANISTTAGPFESILHLLMFGEAGIAILMCLLCEINALVLLLLIGLFICHEITALWDVRYATARREVNYWEQHFHSFLEMLPLTAIALLASLHWQQARALIAFNGSAEWSLRWKSPPLPRGSIALVLTAAVLAELIPYGYELWLGWRAKSGGGSAHRTRQSVQ
jgi:hypothetical protein